MKRATWWTALGLFLLVLLLFWPATGFEFTNFDDAAYIFENPMFLDGLSWKDAIHAFKVQNNEYWLPALWLSYMADIQLFGMDARGFHLTNVILHCLNVVLIYILWLRVTHGRWTAFISTLLFAIHPLRVESVAWVAERKGLLSTFFLLLGLLAYVAFTRTRQVRWYAVLLAAYIMSLMSKPLLVTLPFLLLFMDIWPLQRVALRRQMGKGEMDPVPWKTAVLEKTPLLLPAGSFAWLTVMTQSAGRHDWEGYFSVISNTGRAALSCFVYLRDLLWPAGLGVRFYDLHRDPPVLLFILAVVGLTALTAAILLFGRFGHPEIMSAWLWYITALAPVSGIIPTGIQWTADRFTYVSDFFLIFGILSALDRHVRGSARRHLGAAMLLVAAFSLGVVTRQQLWTWKDARTLADRAVSLAPLNVESNLLLAGAYRNSDPERAIGIYRRTLELAPDDAKPNLYLGTTLVQTGRVKEAVPYFMEAARLDPDLPTAHFYLGDHFFDTSEFRKAAEHYQEFLRLRPHHRDSPHAHNQLGLILRETGSLAEATDHFRTAVEKAPHETSYRYNLALNLADSGLDAEASDHYARVLEMNPEDHIARVMYAEHLRSNGNSSEARKQYRELIRRFPETAEKHFSKGRLLEMDGDPEAALAEYRKGLELEARYPEIRAGIERAIQQMKEGS